MQLIFSREARGPAWERWAILEEQHGDMAFAGEVILTFTDESVYADVDCTVLCARTLNEDEVEDVIDAAHSIISGRGRIGIFTTQEIAARTFNMLDEDEEEPSEN